MGWAGDSFFKSMLNSGLGRPGNGSSLITSSGTFKDGRYYNNCKDSDKDNKYNSNKKYTKYYDYPTEKQQKAMNFISNTLGVIFEGKTKKEASKFIDEYLNKANNFLKG